MDQVEKSTAEIGASLGLVKSFDISNNKLEGEIPSDISCLVGLVSLNLSKNNLNGTITTRIGQITSLEFLDLSNNHLCGKIPTSFANLSYLGILDLSNNNLSGKVPKGTQLQSFNSSAYMGNAQLFGAPLPKNCSGDEPLDNNGENICADQQDDDDSEVDVFSVGLYVSVVLGFVIGFWGVCGSLVLKKSWRHAYFGFFFKEYSKA